jgi:hypothetical protein
VSSMMVKCESCTNSWKLTGNWSPLVQEMVESRPCPKCGAETLCCAEAVPEKRAKGPRRRASEPRVLDAKVG